MTVVTRFAPSPTGMLHIGGARTALFNYLFAKHHGGKFLLRVEDTDKARSTDEATQAILDGMNWLGLHADEDIVFQSKNVNRHVECAQQMIANGTAFKCYATPEELQARRDAGEEKRKAAKADVLSDAQRNTLLAEADELLAPYRSPWRDGGDPPSPDAPYTIRLRAPDDEEIAVSDRVQGKVTLKTREIDDLILLRADGTPTYMLAVVVDDHDMGVTHVIRGDDHFRNTFRQLPIYQAMGWHVPEFAHVPMIHGSDGAKLSKRHGALSTLAYQDMGYLPEAMNSYLVRLGWSHGDQEVFTMEEAAAVFDLDGVNKAPGRLDLEKLGDVNAHFIRSIDETRLLALLGPEIEKLSPLTSVLTERVQHAIATLKERGQTLPELAESCRFLWDSNAENLNKRARKALREDGIKRLSGLHEALDAADSWTIEALQGVLDTYCAAHTLSMGQVGPPLRAALTGGLPAPDLAPVMYWLGRDEVLARIDNHLPTLGGLRERNMHEG
ncbi:MAG: glutamate--tRNA ligase [Alphaproteobacteria bacterium]|nr:glutamate--tRNA ligase [Alphaproteobacteria bacterium]